MTEQKRAFRQDQPADQQPPAYPAGRPSEPADGSPEVPQMTLGIVPQPQDRVRIEQAPEADGESADRAGSSGWFKLALALVALAFVALIWRLLC